MNPAQAKGWRMTAVTMSDGVRHVADIDWRDHGYAHRADTACGLALEYDHATPWITDGYASPGSVSCAACRRECSPD